MMPAELRSDDVAIDQLRVIAPSGTADQVQRTLVLASWPRVPDSSWVFIREVRAKATENRLAQTLSDQARSLMEGPGSPTDNGLVMRFDNFTMLLVSLLSDLARGCASQRWYWRRWSYLFKLPAGKAIADIMEAHIDYLPAATAGLAGNGELASVWRHLGRAEALRLSAIIARRNGFDLQTRIPSTDEAEDYLHIPELPREQYIRWATILQLFPRQDPRRNLALLLIGQERFPLFLQKAPRQLINALNFAFSGPERQPQEHSSQGAPSTSESNTAASLPQAAQDNQVYSASPQRPAEDAGHSNKQPRSGTSAQVPEDLEGENRGLPIANHPGPSHSQTTALTEDAISLPMAPVLPETENQQSGITIITEKNDAAPLPTTVGDAAPCGGTHREPRDQIRLEEHPSPRPLDNFRTAQGGLFFLLNFLKHENVQHLIRRSRSNTDVTSGFTSGWGWLYRLGQELALDEADPVTTFLALQLGLQNTAQLQTLPPLPAREQLLNLARRLYGRVCLWRPSLLRLNATVHFTPSHVDLYAPLTSVRLPVRLAGLDLDPGWLPWLARVVTFHYVA